MSFPVRSTLFSLCIHAVGGAVLFLVPISVTDRFTAAGHQQVISIELSWATPSAIPPPATLIEMSRIEPLRVIDSPRLDRLDQTDVAAALERFESDPTVPAEDPLEFRSKLDVLPSRRSTVSVDRPSIETSVPPRPRRKIQRPFTPPAIDSVPIPQTVGLSSKTPADFSSNSPPKYPVEAVRKGLEGTVLLRLHVGRSGDVTQVEIIESSGHHALDRAAVDAVKRWKGQPAQRLGRAVASEEVLPVRFRL